MTTLKITFKFKHRVYLARMTKNLHRYYGNNDLHFITCSCYHRQPILHTPERRDLFIRTLEEARQKYRFVVHGYVVMPEHFHLLITEPEVADPSVVMKVLKERFTKKLRSKSKSNSTGKTAGAPLIAPYAMSGSPVWQKRFYDFNVRTDQKRIEKLRYIHRNPVKRGLVDQPEHWQWSSFRSYLSGEAGLVRVNLQEWPLEIKTRPVAMFASSGSLIHKVRE